MNESKNTRMAVLAVAFLGGGILGFVASELRQSGLASALGAEKAEPATATSGAAQVSPAEAKRVQRFGSAIRVKPEKLDEYLKLHANAWPGVLDMIRRSNLHNYSIYLGKLDDGNLYLFSYFEYTGDDLAADSKKMAADPTTQEWWKHTDPCQIPLKERKAGEHWMTLREVFHTD
jgi:L-rhamnose mutarotase